MNILEHMAGNVTPEHKFQCLARHIAHWNGFYRESWLTEKWEKLHGKESCNELRKAATDARILLIGERDRAKRVGRDAGKAALDTLRGD